MCMHGLREEAEHPVDREEWPMEQDEQLGEHEKQATARMLGFRDMITAYSQMRNSLKALFSSEGVHKPKLIIALDEAHTLSMVTPNHYHPLTILCRAISLYSGGGPRVTQDAVWVVFASTALKVIGIASPQPYYNSARVFADEKLAFPSFCQLGWDQMADPLHGIAATDVAQAGHIMGYGRALWKSIQGNSVAEMIAIAIAKLCGVKKAENIPLAVLSQRFCLHVAFGHHEAVKFLESSVASNLRVRVFISEDRNSLLTTYPSESLLSCAAASLLHTMSNLDKFLQALEEKILNGMIDVGKSGELTSRLLWLIAKDLYIRRTPLLEPLVGAADGQEWNSELIDCQMISVIDYFRFVFGENFWEQAGETAKWGGKKTKAAREKAKAACEQAKAAFNNAFVNFSHWVSMNEDISVRKNGVDQLPADEWTLRHWHRTSAVQCCHGQPLVDKMIPTYFKDNDPSCRDLSRVSQIFISDKARRSPNKKDLSDIIRNHDSINCGSSRPWVAILVDLGLKESTVEFTFPERWSGRSTTEGACDGPCLRIYASAINSNTFPFLSRSEQLPLTLRNIIAYEETPPNGRQLTKTVQEQVEYGSTSMGRHMRWEAWGETQSSKAKGKKRKASV
ncbi:hypothetical protein EDD17DRAFT_1510588 [Pisolithus thermaeus]|nr:hypothetical protein EDD17DRAFT_1510588 [Pisolithus thermaeus]